MTSTGSESNSDSDISKTRKARSCSSFAGKKDLDGTPNADIWLLDRRALSTRMIRHDGFPDEGVIRMYEEYTDFYKLPEVKFQVELSMNSNIVAPARDFQQYIRHLQAETPGRKTLENSVFNHITPYLWLMNRLSVSARDNLEEIHEHKVLEADSRTEWDVLISILLKSKRDPSIGRVFDVVSRKERAIKLFHNEFASSIQTDNTPEKWELARDLFNAYSVMCFSEVGLDRNTTHTTDFLKALAHRVENYYISSDKRNFVEEIHLSPSKAVVDNLGMISVPAQLVNQVSLSRLTKLKPLHNETDMNKKPPNIDQDFLSLSTEETLQAQQTSSKNQETSQTRTRTMHLKVPSNPSSKGRRNFAVPPFPPPHHLVRSPSITPTWAKRSANEWKAVNMAHLAYVVHEYKRPLAVNDHDVVKNINQLRMSLVSIVAYLEKLGITHFPVFGVAVNGYMALVISAWSGTIKKQMPCIYVGDRDTVQYNLADPVSAYNYCTFLSMLALFHGPRLFKRLQALTVPYPGADATQFKWTTHEQKKDFEEKGLLPKKKKNKQKANQPTTSQPQDHKPQGEASESQSTSVPLIHVPEQSGISQARATTDATSSQPVSMRTRSATRARLPNERVDVERHQIQPAANPRK